MNPWPEDGFFDVARRVYASDRYWLGEDPQTVRDQFTLEACQPGRAIWVHHTDSARLAALTGPDQIVNGQPTAFFGFWESLPDSPDCQPMFDAAAQWARSQGATRLLGPINFSTFYPYRIRLNAFDQGAFPGEPWNPPYYAALLEQAGFRIEKRFFSWLGPLAGRAERLAPAVRPLWQALCDEGLTFSPLKPDTWLNELDDFYEYVDQIFGHNYAYRRISRAAFRDAFGESFANRFCPHCSVLARAADGSIAGFFIAFPDYGPLVRVHQPAPTPLRAIRYSLHAPQLTPMTMLGKSGGVHPAYRQKGLFAVMSWLMMQWADPIAQCGGAVLVREDNPSARVAEQAFGTADCHRREYALFVKDL